MKETPMIRGTSLQEINSRLNDCFIFLNKIFSEVNVHGFSIITTFLIHLSEQVFGNNYCRRDREQHGEQGEALSD